MLSMRKIEISKSEIISNHQNNRKGREIVNSGQIVNSHSWGIDMILATNGMSDDDNCSCYLDFFLYCW